MNIRYNDEIDYSRKKSKQNVKKVATIMVSMVCIFGIGWYRGLISGDKLAWAHIHEAIDNNPELVKMLDQALIDFAKDNQ